MDQDDLMLSTPSSNLDVDESMITTATHDQEGDMESDEMFPTSNHAAHRPRTPQNDHLNAAAPGELSPPRSQTNARDRDADMQQDEDLDLSPTNANLAAAGAGGAGAAAGAAATGDGNGSQDTEWKAGYGWKNKKAQAEMNKAMEGFLDRDFDLKQFGDVLAHRIGLDAGQ